MWRRGGEANPAAEGSARGGEALVSGDANPDIEGSTRFGEPALLLFLLIGTFITA